MKTIELTTQEVLNLYVELAGNPAFKGIISLDIPFVTRYRINRLLKNLEETKETFSKTQEECIKRYGVEDEKQNWSIPKMIIEDEKEIENPNYVLAFSEINKILDEKVTVEYILSLEDFSEVKHTENHFAILFKLLEN